MFLVKEANHSGDVERILKLRYKVLREPWNQPIETATDTIENTCVNAYIEDENRNVIACGRLQENEGKIGQIRFMAVSDEYQGKGLGRLIIQYLEKRGHDLKLTSIELQARENALNFYKNSGYTIKEKSFLLWGIIQHYLMEKTL